MDRIYQFSMKWSFIIFYLPVICSLFLISNILKYVYPIIFERYGLHPNIKPFLRMNTYFCKEFVILVKSYSKWLNLELPENFFQVKQPKTKKDKPMAKSINPKKEYPYILKADRKLPKDQQTIFKVKMLTLDEESSVRDELYQVSGTGNKRKEKFITGTNQAKVLELGLKGWDNFPDPDAEGKTLTFNKDDVRGMCNFITPADRSELAKYIQEGSDLDEGEE